MDAKLALVFIITLLTLQDVVEAEFFFNRKLPSERDLDNLGLKCIPGRTVIKMSEKGDDSEEDSKDSEVDDTRRSHMRFSTDDESCQICVCSVEAKDEYCSRRPAMNVNECMRMAGLMEQFLKNEPFDHERALAYRIRRVGDGSRSADSQKCTPFVSMYSDCTEENRCEGCHRCTCSAEGRWECEDVSEGCEDKGEDVEVMDEKYIDTALNDLLYELKTGTKPKPQKYFVPPPPPPPETLLVSKMNKVPDWDDLNESAREDEKFVLENIRKKRDVKEKDADKGNGTVTFHHTVDELNEDTLKNTNASGTLPAAKVEAMPMVARRSSPLTNSSTPLQIEYSPPLHSQHASDNKVDSPAPHDDQLDLLVHHKIFKMVGNQTKAARDKDLSKLVVNELKGGQAEYIGDNKSPVISNITFTPENDTLTAMAFIAGNLLNKLWNIEKDSDDSLETEHMKHKKINDLLELFKEPLNLRQETFLKSALQQLSKAMEKKNVGNLSICENIEELKKSSDVKKAVKDSKPILKSSDRENVTPKTDLPEITKKTAAAEALKKISNILDLIKKYEQTHNAIFDIKNSSKLNSTVRKFIDKEETTDLSNDEKTTLNLFGNVLESLTKLIVPNKRSKKIIKGVKGNNIFISDQDIKDKHKKLNLTDMSLTTKDKIVLDYLTHIQNNPSCLLNKPHEKPVLSDVKGDIILNLSEFSKIKSMSDLLKLVDSDNKKEEHILRTATIESELPSFENIFTTEATTTKTTTIEKENNMNRFEATKEKLKDHLKTIMEDLVELQNISGKSVNGKNIEVSEALPCIYNLIKSKNLNYNFQTTPKPRSSFTKQVADPINKITEVINNLKKELQHTAQTRRSNVGEGKRPKSAIVWERTVKNMASKNKLQTRRNLQSNAKTFDEIKATINLLENSGSNTYKSIAYLAEVPAAERLLLLKTLALDTNRYISVINEMIKTTNTLTTTLSTENSKTLSEFLDNVDINLNLNGKIVNRLGKPKKDMYLSNKEVRPTKKLNVYNTEKEVETASAGYNTVKLSRDQIINQLIKNRMMYYLKQNEEGEEKGGMNSDLARKILLYLEIGNDNLARELFKIFISQKKDSMNSSTIPVYESKPEKTARRTPQIPVPLIQFEDPSEAKPTWMNQDQLMKQLFNIKNMRM